MEPKKAHITAYPLTWPAGWKRTAPPVRRYGQFSNYGKPLSAINATERVLSELSRLGVKDDLVVISTNLQLRVDGLPRSDQRQPNDPGAAVYWNKPGESMKCIATDRYHRVEDNLAAIAATLEAMRAIERHGGAEILDRAFTGFKALNSENAGPSWWSVLGVDATATEEQINAAYRLKAKKAHPDVPGGSDTAIRELNIARDQGIAVVKGRE